MIYFSMQLSRSMRGFFSGVHCENLVKLQEIKLNKNVDISDDLVPWIFFFFFFTLKYCIDFAIHWPEYAMGVHVLPILTLPVTSLPIPSLRVIPVHQPWAPCFMHQTWTGDLFTYENIHVSMLFSQIIPPSPSPTESKSLFFTSVSLLLSHI